MNAESLTEKPQGLDAPSLYVLGVGITNIGTWMQKIGVGWLAWDLSHSAVWVGAISVGDLLSALLITPFAGAITDRRSPYKMFQTAQAISFLQSILLFAVAFSHHLNIETLFILTIILSIIQGFSMPVGGSLLAKLAGPARLPQMIAANSFAFNVARAVGPALASLIIFWLSVSWVFLGNAVSYLIFILLVYRLRRKIDVAPTKKKSSLIDDIIEGFRYVVTDPQMKLIFAFLFLVSLLLRPAQELFPVFAGSVFKGSPGTLSQMATAFGVGGLAGGLWMVRRQKNKDVLLRALFISSALFCLSIISFSLSNLLLLTLFILLFAGIFTSICTISMQSLVQTTCRQEFRGRALASYQLVFRGAPALGAVVIGVSSKLGGIQLSVILGALLAALILSLLLLKFVRNNDVISDMK